MRRPSTYLILMVLLLNIMATYLAAQVKVQVVSQSVSKKIDYSTGMSLVISGEHAEIYCTENDENSIGIDLEIISRHEDKVVAESDIKKMKWLVEVKSGICYVRNYIELGKNEPKPLSSLKAVYHLKIPKNCPVEIRDYFGRIEVDSLHTNCTINSEFSPIGLKEVTGNLHVSSLFGDITISRIAGETTIVSNRSNIDISGSSGNFRIDASSATIAIRDKNDFNSLVLAALGSSIIFYAKNLFSYTYTLSLSESVLNIAGQLKPEDEKKEKGATKFVFNLKPGLPVIEFHLENSTLTIEQSND